MALGGQAGLGDPSAVDRMQRLVEIRGPSFLRNADSELKIQECRPNLSFFYAFFHPMPGWRSWTKHIRMVSNLWKCSDHAHTRAKNRDLAEFQRLSLFSLLSLTYEHEISGGPHGCSENRPRPGLV